jgi:hypothetical protein
MGVGSASVVDYANTYPGTASHVNATGSVGDFEVVVDGSGATTLSLNFQTATSLDPRITFSRTSNATVVGSDGLIQYAPHNLLTYSEQFDNAAWTKRSGSTVNANTLIAPDGTLTADTQTNTDTTTNGTYIRKIGAFTADNTVYCASCYFKQGSQPIALITMYSRLSPGSNLRVLYDLNAGTYTLSNIGSVSGGTAGMEYIGNGWWRVWASANMLAGSDTTGVQFTPSGWAIPSAIGSEYGYIWGAQLNEGALQPYYTTTVKNLLGYSQSFENAAWTKSNSSVLYNLLTYSSEFDNAAWAKTNATVSANTITAPDGTTTADTVVYSGASGTPSQTITSATTTYTISTYVKSSNTSFCRLRVSAVGGGSTAFSSYFNIITGTVSATNVPTVDFGSLLPSITSVGNGWYRISVTFTVLSALTSITYGIVAAQTSGSASAAGDELYIWGAQLVQSTSPEEYTATTSASAPIQAIGPFGFDGGQKLVENTTASVGHYIQPLPSPSFTVGQVLTYSVYTKAAERTFLQLILTGVGSGGANLVAGFDLTNGVAGTPNAGTSTIVPIGNGWFRCSFTISVLTAASTGAQIRLSANSSSTPSSYTGDGTSGIYIFGAQLSDSASLDPYSYNPVAAPTSTAYYGPRFDYDPATLAPKGLLIEEQRTNLLTYSSECDNAVWFKDGITVTANTTVSPDGTQGADTIVESASTAVHYIVATNTSLTSGVAYTLSIYAKAKERTFIQVCGSFSTFGSNVWGNFNLADGTVGFVGSSAIATITNAGNGWYRCSITASATITASGTIAVSLLNANTNSRLPSYTGDGTSGLYIWGAQLEAGAFPTSYIPTTSATVTRAADNASMVGSNFSSWYNQSEGTIYASADRIYTGNFVGYPYIANLSDGTNSSNEIAIYGNSGNVHVTTEMKVSGTQQLNYMFGVWADGFNKSAVAYKQNDTVFAFNGSTKTTDTSCNVPTVDRLNIGFRNPSNQLNGHIQSIKYYPTRLPNGTLQGLTA